MRDSIKIITLSAIVCSVFIGATYLHAEWANPPSNPPDGNVAAPINTSGSDQFKDGGAIGADRIIGFDMIRSHQNIRAGNNIWSENNVRAENYLISEEEVRSDQYCDRWGNNCFSPADVGGAGQEYESCEVCNFFGCTEYLHGQTRSLGCSAETSNTCHALCASCSTVSPGTQQCVDGEWQTVTSPTCYCNSGD